MYVSYKHTCLRGTNQFQLVKGKHGIGLCAQETQHASTTWWTIYQPNCAQSKHKEKEDTVVLKSQCLTLIKLQYFSKYMGEYEGTGVNINYLVIEKRKQVYYRHAHAQDYKYIHFQI